MDTIYILSAFYGLLRSSNIFYLKLETYLKNNGFVINPYDLCMVNKMVKGEALTLVWYFDYPKVSHKDLFEATKFAQYFLTIYGKN